LKSFGVTTEKSRLLELRMSELKIKEDDLIEKFIKGSGPGGQKVNKTSSCVYLHHLPSSIEIKCQKTRSQSLNRYYARQLLCDELEEIVLQEKSKRQKEREKIRRQKRKRSKRSQEKILQDKKQDSVKKSLRKRIDKE